MKEFLKITVKRGPVSGLLKRLERLDSRRPNLLRVLNYHRVQNPEGFREQMDHVASRYRVLSVADLLEALSRRAPLPPRSLLITFDDAYRDFASCAWPILKERRLPVILFVPTAYPDNPALVFWWDRLEHAFEHTARRERLSTPLGTLPLGSARDRARAFRRLRAFVKTRPHQEALQYVDELCAELDSSTPEAQVLGWDGLRRLAAEGVTLGSHTRTHPLLSRISLEDARREFVQSQADLEREIGTALPVLAYPAGGFNPGTVETLKEAGLRVGFTTVPGTNLIDEADPLRLRRISVGNRSDLSILHARLVESSFYLNRWHPLPESC